MVVFQRNTKRQTLNERGTQFPIFDSTQGTLRRQNKFSCLSRFGIVHEIAKESHTKPK